MKLKLPPLLIFVIFLGLMYFLSKYLPIGDFEFFGSKYLIFTLLGSAILIAFISILQFSRSKTTIDPRVPSKVSKLVTYGVYKFSRNPMYLALLLILLAWGLWLGNAFNTLLAAGFVGYMNRFQIIPEEEALTAMFGKRYQQYCKQVRRWF